MILSLPTRGHLDADAVPDPPRLIRRQCGIQSIEQVLRDSLLFGQDRLARGFSRMRHEDGLDAQSAEPRHRMTKITETIYRADAPGTPGINATSWVFINDADVLVTDSEGSPASAQSLMFTSSPKAYALG